MAKETHHRYFKKKNLFAIYRKFPTLINEHRKRQVINFIFSAPYSQFLFASRANFPNILAYMGALHIGTNLQKSEEISRLLKSGCTEMHDTGLGIIESSSVIGMRFPW